MKAYTGPPATLGSTAAAQVRLMCGAVIAATGLSPTRPILGCDVLNPSLKG